MSEAVLALALVTCAQQYDWRKPSYPDLERTIDAIECAVAIVYGPATARRAMDREIVTTDDYPFAGWFSPDSGIVIVADDAASAKASALRHEFFAHVVPYVLHGDPNPYHYSEVYNLAETNLNHVFWSECW